MAEVTVVVVVVVAAVVVMVVVVELAMVEEQGERENEAWRGWPIVLPPQTSPRGLNESASGADVRRFVPVLFHAAFR